MRIQILQNTWDIYIIQIPQPTDQEGPSSDHMLTQSTFSRSRVASPAQGKPQKKQCIHVLYR